MLSLQDEHDINAVILRYADAMDRRDWARFRTCFTSDFTADYGPGALWSGAEEISAVMENMYRDLGQPLHRITNIVITDAGGDVTVRSYVHGLSPRRDGTMAMQAEGYYDDVMAKNDGSWKIRKRRFVAARLRSEPPAGELAGN